MLNVSVFFIITGLISLGCVIAAAMGRRRNYGFIVSATLVIVCDILSYILINSKHLQTSRIIFIMYYMIYAFMFLTVLWMVSAVATGYKHHFKHYFILSAIVCVYQVMIIAGNLFGIRSLGFARHVLFGQSWWYAEGNKSYSVFFSFGTYNVLSIIAAVIILCMMTEKCVRSDRLFRPILYVFIICQILVCILGVITYVMSMPTWINALAINVLSVIGMYYTTYYPARTLRDWSMMSFADEMNDGFILYDQYDDLVHYNDAVRSNMPDRLLEAFKDKEFLDNWLSHTQIVEGIETVDLMWDKPDDEDTPDDRSPMYLQVRSYELGEKGSHIGTVYVLHNKSETIFRLQAMKEANIELERAARMKSDFLANMSHEIRTPMNAVIGMAEIALREELPDSVVDYLIQIKNSGRNLLNIINDILDFSKIEAGKMEFISERYEPLSEMNDIANIMQTRIGDKNLEFFVVADTDIPHALIGDAMRIRQVIINLANNAIKFTAEGTVKVRMSARKMTDDTVMMEYHIVDTGVGIKEDDLKKLFESFQQVDSKRNRSVEGTGLGLAISKSLVENMGGSIGVTSTYGQGSDFYFTLPQQLMDDTNELIVDDAVHKHAFCLNDNPKMYQVFLDEMTRLKVDGHAITSVDQYVPTGEKDFIFFTEQGYDDVVKTLLDDNRALTGVIMVGIDSAFTPDRPNLRIMRRPETTLNMVMTLNDRQLHVRVSDNDHFVIDYTAPDAKILIVDDNAINITIAEGLLEPIHATCFSALDARTAIEMLGTGSFDIILMDHMMPEMDGIEATGFIRANIPSAKDIPIIALTANVMEDAKTMFTEAGMNDFIAKPIEISSLINCVRKWLPKDKIKIIEGAPGDISSGAGDGSRQDTAPDIDTEYEGLDHVSAQKAIGSAALYKKIVEEYYRSGASKLEGIRNAYDAEDWSDYTIRVHALKSSSRQIGASELGDMAARMEDAGKAGDTDAIRSSTDELLSAFRQVLSGLEPYFAADESDRADAPLIDEAIMHTLTDKLIEACDNLDMDAMEEVKEAFMRYSYPGETGDKMKRLYEAIDNIDIDACTEILESL